MKKLTLLAVVLVVSMGAAHAQQGQAMLGTQSARITTGGPEAEARLRTQDPIAGGPGTEAPLGTQSANIRQCRSVPVLGTQAVTRYTTVCDDEVDASAEPMLGKQSGFITTGSTGAQSYTR